MSKMDSVVHFEMPYDDRERMAKFYQGAFGWQMRMLGEEMGNYVLVTIQASALQSVKLIKGAELKIYKGAPHGMCTTRKEEVNADLLSFFQTKVSAPGKRAA